MSRSTTPNDNDSDDPFAPIRENREDVEALAATERDDSLAAWARVLLALADDEQPDEEDLEKANLPSPEVLRRC